MATSTAGKAFIKSPLSTAGAGVISLSCSRPCS